MAICDNCGKESRYLCQICETILPMSERVAYCSETCRLAHQPIHQPRCDFARYQYNLRGAVMNSDAVSDFDTMLVLKRNAMDYHGRIPTDALTNYADYMSRVRAHARMYSIFYNTKPQLNPKVLQQIQSLKEFNLTHEEYASEWKRRTTQETKDKWNTSRNWEVPFDCRPVLERKYIVYCFPPDEEITKYEMEIFPQDYDELDYRNFLVMFGGGRRQTVDVFRAEAGEKDTKSDEQPQK